MADEFQSGLCSGGSSWWNTARTSSSYDMSVSIPCSTAVADVVGVEGTGAFSWTTTELLEAKSRTSGEENSVSNSSVIQSSDHANPSFMDSSLQLPSDWTQTLLRSSGRVENSFQAILQEDLSSSSPYIRQEQSIDNQSHQIQESMHTSSINQFKEINHNFLLDSNNNQGSDAGMNYPFMQAGCSSTMMQDMFQNTDNKLQNFIYDNRNETNYQSPLMTYRENTSEVMQPTQWAKFTELLKSSPPKQQQQQQQSNQLQFSNNTPFWNASATTAPGYVSAIQQQFSEQSFESKSLSNTLTLKGNQEGFLGSSSTKKSSSEPAFKKPRIETPSPLPTFKVRKEKLGDRITALQQLVSPFGKTDTASVLHEAIEYIKFLHDQVGVLSTPYLKSSHHMQQQQQQQGAEKSKDDDGTKQLDLRSRGLCLVPLSSTYPAVATETTVDLWHPTFGGTFR